MSDNTFMFMGIIILVALIIVPTVAAVLARRAESRAKTDSLLTLKPLIAVSPSHAGYSFSVWRKGTVVSVKVDDPSLIAQMRCIELGDINVRHYAVYDGDNVIGFARYDVLAGTCMVMPTTY